MEVKGVPAKKRYFCNLILGNEPYKRTFTKRMSRMCFWGEYFELQSIPQFCSFRVELMRDGGVKRPGHKKIGCVEIDLPSVSSCPTKLVDEWYAVKGDHKHDREIPSLRIKHRFQSLDILPLHRYTSLRLYLRDNATTLCNILEPLLCVKAKEDIASALVNIMQAENMAIPFLVNLILTDVERIDNEHLLLRGNSIATKAIEAYMRLVGEFYLQETLSETIQTLISATEDLEVDPLRITTMAHLSTHREALKTWASNIWEKIVQSGHRFPVELRRIFHAIRQHLLNHEKNEVTDKLISACVFLRFLCPAILYPSLFNITQEYPEEGTVRNLTLVAKTLQTLANFTSFRGKENFMEFLNVFIDREQDRCRTFLRIISSVHCEEERDSPEFMGQIDIGRHCALLHLHLSDALTHSDTQVNQNEISQVISLVEGVSSFLGTDRKRKQPITCQISSHAASSLQLANQSYLQVPAHVNNNYIDDQSDKFLEPYANDFVEVAMDGHRGATRKIFHPPGGHIYDLPRSRGSRSFSYFSREKTAATDLLTSDDYVFVDAIDQRNGSPSFPNPLMESNNNNDIPANEDWRNENSYYMSEVPRPEHRVHNSGSIGSQHSPLPHPRYSHNNNHGRLYPPRATAYPSRSHSVSGVPSPLERRRHHHHQPDSGNPETSSYSPLDACSQQIGALMVDADNIQGSQTSISQISNVASSGYQSFVYSQSSSPVDSLLQADNGVYLPRENRSLTPPVINHAVQVSPLASPNRQASTPTKRHRAANKHPSHLRYTGHASAHGTPRHVSRMNENKESNNNSNIGASQSVEDLPTFRCDNDDRRRSCSSSSDESTQESPPPSLCARARLHLGGAPPLPRTNPLYSPRSVHSAAFRQELHARINQERAIRSARRKGRISNQEDLHQEDYDDDKRSTRGSVSSTWRTDDHQQTDPEDSGTLTHVSSYQLLGHQEKQMRAIVDKLASMEQEFRHEQNVMWQEIHRKEVRIDDQAKKIAELDNANAQLSRTVAKLNNNI